MPFVNALQITLVLLKQLVTWEPAVHPLLPLTIWSPDPNAKPQANVMDSQVIVLLANDQSASVHKEVIQTELHVFQEQH